jgi:hypothetical protein
MERGRRHNGGAFGDRLCGDEYVAIKAVLGGSAFSGSAQPSPKIRRRAPGSSRDGDVTQLAREFVETGEAVRGADADQLSPELIVRDLRDQEVVLADD